MCCAFGDRCVNEGTDKCYTCHFNPEACTQDHFEYWSDCGLPEPTQEELDNAIEN